MQWYPWLNKYYQRVILAYQEKKCHHALLFKSNPNNGLEVLLYAISRWLICQNRKGIKSCSICKNCKLMKSNNHPDYFRLKLDGNSCSIGVEQVRNIINILYNYSHQHGSQVISLENVDYFTQEAMHVLLKTIEDPPDNTYFLLYCYNKNSLLSTLLSRCYYWFISTPSEEEGMVWLNNQIKIKKRIMMSVALKLYDGSPIAAQKLLESDNWNVRIKLCNVLFNSIYKCKFIDLFPLLNCCKEYDTLNWFLSLLIDTIKWKLNMKCFLVNIDQIELINYIASVWSLEKLCVQCKQWTNCIHNLNKTNNINKELILINQLLHCE